MQQRQLRLGDILDDYCPRERRVTNHAVVAMVGEDVKQTRCTTCDAEHEYKHAKVPRQRRKAETPAALYSQVLPAGRRRSRTNRTHRPAPPRPLKKHWNRWTSQTREMVQRRRRVGAYRRTETARTEDVISQDSDTGDERRGARRRGRGPVHRPLIRASLPRPEGQPPPARPTPEFTIRQPGGRPNRFRPRHQRAAAVSSRGTAGIGNMRRRRPPRRHALRRRAAVRRARCPRAVRRASQALPGANDRSNAGISTPLRETGLIHMPDLSGKHGLIVGVANKRSISWAIAQAAAAAGARLALTYPSERLEENVRELAATLENPLLLPCDVAERSSRSRRWPRRSIANSAGSISSCTARRSRRPTLSKSPFVQTSREGFRIALDVSAYSLIALTRAVAPLMEKRGGGSVLTLTYLGSERVFPNYNVMGVAKAALEASVRYLAADLGPQNIRVNAISAGPIKTLAAAGISGFSSILQVYRERAPLRRNVELAEVADAALFLLGPASRAITGEVVMVDAGFHVTSGV